MTEQPIFERYENGESIHKSEFAILSDYFCRHMNAYWSPNKGYFYRQYHILNHFYEVAEWREKRGLEPVACRGETVYKGEIVNFIVDSKYRFLDRC